MRDLYRLREVAALVICHENGSSTLCYTLFMKIRIRYFASLREVVGQSEEIVTLHEGMTIADVRVMLSTCYPRLQSILERSLCAVNHGYVTTDTILHEGDELVFIPPMGGGTLLE